MTLQDAWFTDSYLKMCANDIALDLGETTAGYFKGAMFDAAVGGGAPDWDQANPAYGSAPWNDHEATGPGYTGAGQNLVLSSFGIVSGSANKVAWVVADLVWTATTFTAAGLLVYVPSLSNRALQYRYFGQPYTTDDGDFEVAFSGGLWRQKLRATA